jgi:hypothetical protein
MMAAMNRMPGRLGEQACRHFMQFLRGALSTALSSKPRTSLVTLARCHASMDISDGRLPNISVQFDFRSPPLQRKNHRIDTAFVPKKQSQI